MTRSEVVTRRDPVDSEIGDNLRRLRRQRGLSLHDIAGRSDLSIGFLSQIERGLSSPTLRALVSVTDALGVGLGDIFPRTGTQEAESTILRRGARAELPIWRSGIRKFALAPLAEGGRVGLYLVEMEKGASTGDEPYTHRGEEAGVVMEGSMHLTVEGESWILGEGDGFRFLSSRPHRFSNTAPGITRVFWVNVL